MDHQKPGEEKPRTIAYQTWAWARGSYELQIEQFLEDPMSFCSIPSDLEPVYRELCEVGFDLGYDFWTVASSVGHDDQVHKLKQKLTEVDAKTPECVLRSLVDELDRHGQVAQAIDRYENWALANSIGNPNEVRVMYDEHAHTVRVLVPDPLEGYFDADFSLTFHLRGGELCVSLEGDSKQVRMAFPEGNEYWRSENNCFPLALPRVRRGMRILDVGQWARRWLKDYLDHYYRYSGI
jgi:hypothetical protein